MDYKMNSDKRLNVMSKDQRSISFAMSLLSTHPNLQSGIFVDVEFKFSYKVVLWRTSSISHTFSHSKNYVGFIEIHHTDDPATNYFCRS